MESKFRRKFLLTSLGPNACLIRPCRFQYHRLDTQREPFMSPKAPPSNTFQLPPELQMQIQTFVYISSAQRFTVLIPTHMYISDILSAMLLPATSA